MNKNTLPFEKVIFVCTNCRDEGARVCCSSRHSTALHADLKQWVKDNKLKRHVRVCKSGCMDRCEDGPNILIMPDNVWVSEVDADDLDSIKAELLREFAEAKAVD